MACMCGDLCCPSCGPAQGNSRCPICGAWASEGCDHFDEAGDPSSPEIAAQLAAIAEAERKAEDAAYQSYLQEAELYEAYLREKGRASTDS